MAEGRAAVQREGGVTTAGAAMSSTSVKRPYNDSNRIKFVHVQPLELLCSRKRNLMRL